jgi:hypothetical protein
MELSFIPTFTSYELRHEKEEAILAKFLNAEELPKFYHMLADLHKNSKFTCQRCMMRVIRIFQVISILAILGTAYLMITAYMADSKVFSELEMAFKVLCLTITFIFFTIFLTLCLETCCIQKCVAEVKKVLKERISDLFPTFNYTLEVSSYQVITIRPLVFDEGKPLMLGGNDYFEYIRDHRPDSENFYKSTNPFELDPHEKNFAKMMLR